MNSDYSAADIQKTEEEYVLQRKLALEIYEIAEQPSYYAGQSKVKLDETYICSNKKLVHTLLLLYNNEALIHYASEELKNDKDIIGTALARCHSDVFKYIPDGWWNDEKLRELAFKYHALKEIFDAVPEEMRDDKEIILKANEWNEYEDVLKYASESLRDDKEVVLAAAHSDKFDIDLVSHRLKIKTKFMQKIIRIKPKLLFRDDRYIDKHKKNQVFLLSLPNFDIKYIHPSLHEDEKFMLKMLKTVANNVKFGDLQPNIQHNYEVLLYYAERDYVKMKENYNSFQIEKDMEINLWIRDHWYVLWHKNLVARKEELFSRVLQYGIGYFESLQMFVEEIHIKEKTDLMRRMQPTVFFTFV